MVESSTKSDEGYRYVFYSVSQAIFCFVDVLLELVFLYLYIRFMTFTNLHAIYDYNNESIVFYF